MTTEEVLRLHPELTREQVAELAEAANRHTPQCETCRYSQIDASGGHCYMFKEKPPRQCAQWRGFLRLTEQQERARGELAQQLADGESVPPSLFW